MLLPCWSPFRDVFSLLLLLRSASYYLFLCYNGTSVGPRKQKKPNKLKSLNKCRVLNLQFTYKAHFLLWQVVVP